MIIKNDLLISVVGEQGSKKCLFSGLNDLRLLTSFNMADRTDVLCKHFFNCTHLPDDVRSNDLRSDRKHPSKKSADRKWMTLVDPNWVKLSFGYL